MNNLLKTFISVFFVVLVIANAGIFVVEIKSSTEITKMETELDSLRQSNIDLENKLGEVGSLEYAASMAAAMDFSKKAVPTYLDSLKYALNR